MDEEDDDDIYAPEDVGSINTTSMPSNDNAIDAPIKKNGSKHEVEEGEEEGEEIEEDESDSVG